MALGGFNQGVELCTGCVALGNAAERPALVLDHEGVDGIPGMVVIDGQMPAFDVAPQSTPVVAK